MLPGSILNVAKVLHSEFALYTASVLFVIHFYHAHLRPEKFPMDLSVITGMVSEEHLRKYRPDYIARLERRGQARRDAPVAALQTKRVAGRRCRSCCVHVRFVLAGRSHFGQSGRIGSIDGWATTIPLPRDKKTRKRRPLPVENGDAAHERTYWQSMRLLVLRLAAVLGAVLLLLLFMTGGAAQYTSRSEFCSLLSHHGSRIMPLGRNRLIMTLPALSVIFHRAPAEKVRGKTLGLVQLLKYVTADRSAPVIRRNSR